MTAPHVHAARATRRYRKGVWQPVAVCPCGWEKWAVVDKTAAAVAVQHNRSNLPAGSSCDAVPFKRRFAAGSRWPFGLHCAVCNWLGDARDEPEAVRMASAHNTRHAV